MTKTQLADSNTSIPHLSYQSLTGFNIPTTEVIQILEQLIAGREANTVFSAPKAVITPPDGRYIMATLAAMNEPPLIATKSLCLNARNSDIGLPQINGLVSLLHGETGLPLATIDGNWVTAVRTAGLSAVAAKYMANPDSKSVGFIGCGVQARSHLKAFKDLFPLEHVKLFGRGQQNIDAAIATAHSLGLSSEVCDTTDAALHDVNLAVTSITHTAVERPFLHVDSISSGCFVSIVDLAVPWHKSSFSDLNRLIIDDLEQEAALPNKLADPEDVHGDLAGLIMGRVQGRKRAKDRTAFVFRGHALGDLALAALAYRHFGQANPSS